MSFFNIHTYIQSSWKGKTAKEKTKEYLMEANVSKCLIGCGTINDVLFLSTSSFLNGKKEKEKRQKDTKSENQVFKTGQYQLLTVVSDVTCTIYI